MFVLTQFNSVSLHRHLVRTYKFDLFSARVRAAPGRAADAARGRLVPGDGRRGAPEPRDHPRIARRARADPLRRPHVPDGLPAAPGRARAQPARTSPWRRFPVREAEIAEYGAIRVDAVRSHRRVPREAEDAAGREGMQANPALLARSGVGTERPYLASMGIYLFGKAYLRASLESSRRHDFGRDVLPHAVASGQGPVVPVRRVLARHRDDPRVLRRPHGPREGRPAVPLQRSRVARSTPTRATCRRAA